MDKSRVAEKLHCYGFVYLPDYLLPQKAVHDSLVDYGLPAPDGRSARRMLKSGINRQGG